MPIKSFTATQIDNGLRIILEDSGKQMDFLHVSLAEMKEGVEAYNRGSKIQDAFPFLNPDYREFLMSGMTPEEWDGLFADPERDEDFNEW